MKTYSLDLPVYEWDLPVHRSSDKIFGTAAECAEDALLIKRLSLIVVPTVLLICLLTLALARFAA